jgi:hypothetical protein
MQRLPAYSRDTHVHTILLAISFSVELNVLVDISSKVGYCSLSSHAIAAAVLISLQHHTSAACSSFSNACTALCSTLTALLLALPVPLLLLLAPALIRLLSMRMSDLHWNACSGMYFTAVFTVVLLYTAAVAPSSN